MANLFNRLELFGFKSFPDKVTLDFPAKITAVIGPNGSGKSNIADAIRWALGEQSSRNIRAAKSEDIIFSGTPKKTAASLASVSLYFGNENKIFDIEAGEVSITRRVNRNAESEYLINQAAVRLKDVIDLTARAHLGVKGITIINQGDQDFILRASRTERKIIFDEIIGVKDLELKLLDTLRKLDAAHENYEKIAIARKEIVPHLKHLERQKEKWIARQKFEEELTGLRRDLQKLTEKFYSEEEAAIRNKVSDANTRLTELYSKIKKLELNESMLVKTQDQGGESAPISEKIISIEKERGALLKQLGRIEAFLEERIATQQFQKPQEVFFYGNNNPKILFAFIEKIKSQLSDLTGIADITRVRQELLTIIQDIENLLKASQKPELSEDDPADKIRDLRAEKEKFESKINNLEKILLELRRELESLASRQNDNLKDYRKKIKELESLKSETASLNNEKKRLESILSHFHPNHPQRDSLIDRLSYENAIGNSSLVNEIRSKNQGINALEIELAKIGEIDTLLVDEYKEMENRLAYLTSQLDDAAKTEKDLRAMSVELKKKIDREFESGIKELSEYFNEYFRIIFGGGSAKIIIEKSEQELEDGKNYEPKIEIDFKMDIPGKKVKTFEALSGGERALVGIALLLASAKYSSPPFLVLDEIDAPLDERNAAKFAGLVKDLATVTQFVIITHNRATIKIADILYGITMEEGVSKIISLKLEER